MHGLEAVAHIRQGAADDDRHGVGHERFFQILFYVDRRKRADVHLIFRHGLRSFLKVQIGHQFAVFLDELAPGST